MGLDLLLIIFIVAVRDFFHTGCEIIIFIISLGTNIRWMFLALHCVSLFFFQCCFFVFICFVIYIIKLLAIV